jgi:hypothetical protein
MRESVEKELEVLKKMVSAWRKFYEETPYPGCERDFSFEIEEYLLPLFEETIRMWIHK